MMSKKICPLCKNEFYIDYGQTRYCSSKCRYKNNYLKNKEKKIKYAREYWKKNINHVRETNKKRFKKWYNNHENKKNQKKYCKDYYHTHKEKWNIRKYAYKFLRLELLKKNEYKCNLCGCKEKLEIHHREYDNNLNSCVILCRNCHRKEHRKIE